MKRALIAAVGLALAACQPVTSVPLFGDWTPSDPSPSAPVVFINGKAPQRCSPGGVDPTLPPCHLHGN